MSYEISFLEKNTLFWYMGIRLYLFQPLEVWLDKVLTIRWSDIFQRQTNNVDYSRMILIYLIKVDTVIWRLHEAFDGLTMSHSCLAVSQERECLCSIKR